MTDRFDQEQVWGHLEEDPEIGRKVAMFGQIVPSGVETILDVGCGDGAITNPLAERYAVVGVDSSEVALRHLRTEAVLADAAALPFEDGSFDLVLSSQLLEHLDDEQYGRALVEMRRVTRRFLLISVPYREDLRQRLIRCPRCGWRGHVWGHRRSFTIDSLVSDVGGATPVEARIFGRLQAPPWPRPLLLLCQVGLRRFYRPTGQSPLCERCGNTDFPVKTFPQPAQRLKRAIDRRRGREGMPFWLVVLLETH